MTSPLKGRPNETAHRVPFKCHAGVQETMLGYKCYFEWCHGVKLAALNYGPPFDAFYIPAVLSTHMIIQQIPDPGPGIAIRESEKHLVMMIQHIQVFFFFFVWLSSTLEQNKSYSLSDQQ